MGGNPNCTTAPPPPPENSSTDKDNTTKENTKKGIKRKVENVNEISDLKRQKLLLQIEHIKLINEKTRLEIKKLKQELNE